MNKLTDEQFVQAWIEAVKGKTGLQAMADKLDMTYKDLNIRAQHLRVAGVGLPNMPHPNQKRDRRNVNAKSLNTLIVKELGENSLSWRAKNNWRRT